MLRLRLFHWNDAEAAPRREALAAAGYQVEYEKSLSRDLLQRFRDDPPAAFVIDLTRLPSHGGEVALALRQYKGTRHVPLVFVEGDPEKVARIERVLPDAVYTTWSRIRGALKQALAHPPEAPVVPGSVLAGYSGTPLPKKLGIKPHFVVVLMGAPDNFAGALGDLPEGVTFRDQPPGDLTLWFLRSRRELERGIARRSATEGPLWMIWPKKAAGMDTDLTQQDVRELGLAAGLVDYKVCAVDATWSGLLFRQRKAASAATAPRGTSSTPRKQTKKT
jgi:hypothetical protein